MSGHSLGSQHVPLPLAGQCACMCTHVCVHVHKCACVCVRGPVGRAMTKGTSPLPSPCNVEVESWGTSSCAKGARRDIPGRERRACGEVCGHLRGGDRRPVWLGKAGQQ